MLSRPSLFHCTMNRHDVVSEYRKRYGFPYLRKDEEKLNTKKKKLILSFFNQRAITLLTLIRKINLASVTTSNYRVNRLQQILLAKVSSLLQNNIHPRLTNKPSTKNSSLTIAGSEGCLSGKNYDWYKKKIKIDFCGWKNILS